MGDIFLKWDIIFNDDNNTTIFWPQKSANSMRFSRQENRALILTSTSTPTVQRFWRIGGTMISSPCKTCDRINQSKEGCYKECELLQAIQKIQLSVKEDLKESGTDPFE